MEDSTNEEKRIILNMRINYIIIEKFWKYVTKKDKASLYKRLGVNKNTYSGIRTGKKHYVTKREGYERTNLYSKGFPKNIMTGEDIIVLAGISRKDWENYLKWYDKKDTYEKKDIYEKNSRDNALRDMNKKIKKAFENRRTDRTIVTPLDVLYDYFLDEEKTVAIKVDLTDREMKDLYDSLDSVTLEKMLKCDGNLRRKVFDVLEERYEWLKTIVKYDNLFQE